MIVDFEAFKNLKSKEKEAIITKLENLTNNLKPDPKVFVTLMEEVLGGPIEDGQYREYTEARQVLSYWLMSKGYSSTEAGKAIGKHHSTVLHHRDVMKDALDVQIGYGSLLRLYAKYQYKAESLWEKLNKEIFV